MNLFATMCNQPQRLLEALASVRDVLVATPPIARWGLGYVQSGEVLLARTPRPSLTPVDFYGGLEGARSDCVIGHAVSAARPRLGGTDDTPPFRYRRWMYVQDVPQAADDHAARLLGHVPDFLRRNIRGHSTAEVAFHVFLAMLHDLGGIDDANLAMPVARKALAASSALVASELTKAGAGVALGNVAVSNSRALLIARLGGPIWMRRLHVINDRGERDAGFRGVLFVSGEDHAAAPTADGFEEIPAASAVTVSRDLRVDVTQLAG